MVYQWKDAFPYKKYDAQKVGEFLSGLALKIGDIRPSQVVEESKPKDAVLHNYFQWDDEKAAKLYREEQARLVIRAIVVVKVSDEQEKELPTRAFVSVGESEKKYVTINTALEDDVYRKQLLNNAKKELAAFKEKYAILSELETLFTEIEMLLNKSA